jgi:HK97 gp10 family phage protein
MPGFSFKVEGLQKVLSLFNQLPHTVQRELKNELRITAAEMRDGAKMDAPKDESRLQGAITLKEKGLRFEVVNQSFYAGYLEFGTKTKVKVPPGLEQVASQLRGPSGISDVDPLTAITAWVRRKGLAATFSTNSREVATRAGRRMRRTKAEGERERSVAWLIWRHIKKYGIRAQPYFFKQMTAAEPKLRQRIAALIKRIT